MEHPGASPNPPNMHPVLTDSTTDPDLERELESHRRALTGFCYRMLGAGSEAEDAVQETMVRAWKGSDRLIPGARSHPTPGLFVPSERADAEAGEADYGDD